MGTEDDRSEGKPPETITENTVKDLASQLEGVTVDPETRNRITPKKKYGAGGNRPKTKTDAIPKKLKSILRTKKGKSILTKQRKCVRFCEELSEVTRSCHQISRQLEADRKPVSESSSQPNTVVTNDESLVIRDQSQVIHNDSVVKHDGSFKLLTNIC
ncbi:uncharacterized protein LOC121383340 [Gigantopelta aegis]|uniref:uncharacterized protein LOC121383340 n=1 Tax=Gigantopelta aegis TaxID=1735272 RepID=UPI001B88D4AB|nr:uncharacterized protein LOC121383340 [Gigantopelta aegis]